MNQQLSEERIRATCRSLLKSDGRVSGRRLCVELRRRFGAVGKTERVFAIWRAEVAQSVVPVDVADLQRRLAIAELAAAENLARAERAEYREEAHQDKWAAEVDKLRMENLGRPGQAAEIRKLQEQVLRLSKELMEARGASTG